VSTDAEDVKVDAYRDENPIEATKKVCVRVSICNVTLSVCLYLNSRTSTLARMCPPCEDPMGLAVLSAKHLAAKSGIKRRAGLEQKKEGFETNMRIIANRPNANMGKVSLQDRVDLKDPYPASIPTGQVMCVDKRNAMTCFQHIDQIDLFFCLYVHFPYPPLYVFLFRCLIFGTYFIFFASLFSHPSHLAMPRFLCLSFLFF